MNLKSTIRTVPDYPRPGVRFRDITTLLADPDAFSRAVEKLAGPVAGMQIDKVAGIEARGFIFAGALATRLCAGFVPVRKKGKLPGRTIREACTLEYGTAELEIHADAIATGDRILLVDDLIATGGTAGAAIRLLEKAGAGTVICAFLIDLPCLGGSGKLRSAGKNVISVMEFTQEE